MNEQPAVLIVHRDDARDPELLAAFTRMGELLMEALAAGWKPDPQPARRGEQEPDP